MDCEVHGNRKTDQNKPESQRQREVPFTCFQRDRRGQHPCVMVDVATNDHDSANLSDGPAKSGKRCRQKRPATVPQKRGHPLHMGGIQ